MKLLISCGGTGGHFYPGLSIARHAQAEKHDVTLYLAGHHQDAQKKQVQKYQLPAQIAFSGQRPKQRWKLPRYALQMFLDIFKARSYLKKEKFDAILIMGSFAGVTLGIAARLCRTKVFIHEGNTVPGKANRCISRWAKCFFYSFELLPQYKIHCTSELVGMPIRPELKKTSLTKEELCREFNFDPSQTTLLIFGGSQGSKIINETTLEAVKSFNPSLQVIHLTGAAYDISIYQRAYKEAKIKAVVKNYDEDMARLLSLADLAFCRAGASTLAELSFYQCPALFLPLEIAADEHQKHNALLAQRHGAAEVIEEKDFTSESLTEKINFLSGDHETLRAMGSKIKKLHLNTSAQSIISSIIKYLA